VKKRFFPICLVSVVLIALIAVLVPSCTPTTQCTIDVKAALDGSPWSGAVNYTLTPVSGSAIIGTNVSASFSVACGTWTCAYVSGGPAGAYLESITSSATQNVTGSTITFTLNFKTIPPEETCTIEVKATLCDIPWQGAMSYTLTPVSGSVITGNSVPASFTVDCGSWTCAYVSGFPAGSYLDSITPSATQSVSGGSTITFTLNFELNQDAWIKLLPLTWTVNGIPIQGEYYEAAVCNIIDVHFQQGVDGCPQRLVAVNETSLLNINYLQGPGPVQILVVNDICAVNKTPEPPHKWNQVPSFGGQPVEEGWLSGPQIPGGPPILLDVETAWQLVKETDYTKSINWFGISRAPFEPGMQHPCVLFELVLPGPGQYTFTLFASADVELVDNDDVNGDNNHAMSPPLNLTVVVPQ
jgi:hypothetical protein